MTANITCRAVFAALSLALLTAGTLPAQAQTTVYDSASFTNLQPVQTGVAGAGTGTSFSANFTTSGYGINRVRFSGTIEEINGTTGDFLSENQLQVTRPDGAVFLHPLSTIGDYTGATNFTSSLGFTNYNVTAPGTWQFRYFNTFDDTPTGGAADARLNSLLVELVEEFATPPATVVDLGTINGNAGAFNDADYSNSLTFAAGQVQFIKFTLANPIDATTSFLDIDTNGSIISDTEIGLYSFAGALLGTDDDSGNGARSQLSYGLNGTPRPAIGTGLVGNGRNGVLPVGDYYLAVGGFNTAFGNSFAATSASIATGNITVNLRTNVAGATVVPEANAGALALLGIAPIGFLVRRRK